MRDPLEGWTREDAALADPLILEQPGVDATGFGLQVVEVVQPAGVAEVVRVVDHGLDAQGAAFLEVLLDPGVLVLGVDGDVDAAGDDCGGERSRGVGADRAAEDELDLVGPAEVEVVAQQGVEERPAVAGASKTIVREASTWRIESSHQ